MICRRCLLADMEDERPLHALVEEWLAAISDDDKAAPELYRVRLSACQDCKHLMNGLCALCGCYVELRAAKARMSCPNMNPLW